ncbi:MAG: hypothetical protein EA397_19325 [Deltaproteobacteria bacterium]|nr:MAG: hypothetical protein EA397_19325 [Deltaproteobacteria bacterium]
MRALATLTLIACTGTPEPSTPPGPQPSKMMQRDPYWSVRTDAELEAALQQACERAVATERPVLIQFSASWCIDCKKIRSLSTQPPLVDELRAWETLVIDPGRFERHEGLVNAFNVSRLATWIATRPSDCRLPAPGWPRLAEGSFEPVSGSSVTAEQLTAWLKQARQ